MPFNHRAVGRAVHVVLSAYVRLHLLHVAALDAAQFGQLNDPAAARLFHSALALHGHEAVAEPLAAHNAEQRTLAYALGPGNDKTIVVLAPRLHHPRHRRREVLACYHTVQLTILSPYIVNDEPVEPFRAVPTQAVEVVAYRVHLVAREHSRRSVLDLVLAGHPIVLFQIDSQVRVVAVGPRARLPVPGQAALYKVEAAEQVVPQVAGQHGVVLQYGYDVLGGGLYRALAVILQACHPVGLFRSRPAVRLRQINIGKVAVGTRLPLLGEQHPDGLVLRGEVLHHPVRRPSRNVVRAASLVVHAEQVYAAQVEGVAELSARRVGLVPAVSELAAVAHQPCGHAAKPVSVPALGGGFLIHVAEELVYRVLNGVGAAEGSYKPWLLRGFACLAHLVAHHRALTARHGPRGYIPVINVCGQRLVHVARRAVLHPEDKLAVPRRARPVEQPRQLEGGRVEKLYAHRVGYPAAQRLVLVGLGVP